MVSLKIHLFLLGDTMMNRQEYIELHSIEWDIMHSPCGECEFVNNCQYYYGKCPNEDK